MTEQEKEQIKGVNIVDVISSFISVKKSGSDYKACCPFHDEKTPSFVIKSNATENFYKCFGCGAGGDAIEFVQKFKNIDFIEACEVVAQIGNVSITKESNFNQNTETVNKPIQAIKKTYSIQSYQKPKINARKPSKKVIEYFLARGISEKTVELARITESTKYFSTISKEGVSINFNYFRNNELVNVKHRHLESKNFGLEKDCELVLYNLDAITDNGKAIFITEGEFDALSIMETFGTSVNIVSVPNGANSGKNQNISYLDCPKTKKAFLNRKFVLCFDADNPGQNLKDAFIKRFGEEKCLILDYPSGCKDLNDVLVKIGKQGVKDVISQARYNKVNGVLDVTDFNNVIDNYYTNGFPNVDKIGLPSIDDLIGFRGGELTMVTGVSGSGKSEFLDFVMVQLAKKHDWRFGVCSMETPPALHFIKLAEKFTEKPFRDIVDHKYGEIVSNGMSVEDLEKSKYFVYNNFKFISNSVEELADGTKERGVLSIDYILNQAKKLKSMYGIKGLIIDPWNTIEHFFSNNETETNYVSRILSKIIAFAEDFDVHVFLVAHPTKSVKDTVATLNDISGSGNFFNKTHNGISVFREKDSVKNPENIVEVHIQKIKFKFVGRLGVAKLEYNNFNGVYTDTINQIDSQF